MNIAKLVKLAKKASSLDEALEVLGLMGIEVESSPLPFDTAPAADALRAMIERERPNSIGFYAVEANVKGLPLHCFVMVGKLPKSSVGVSS